MESGRSLSPTRPEERSRAITTKPAATRRWSKWAWLLLAIVALGLTLFSDRQSAAWVSRLSRQGGPAPAVDAASPTGYVLGQRQFLGTHERGSTYRWIALTQERLASGGWAGGTYHADNVPVGRPELAPQLYAGWLGGLAWVDHVLSHQPLGISVERAAEWEPILSHALALLALVGFMTWRFGPAAGGLAGLCFALFPLASAQFLPGVLTPRTWALLLAAYALARHLCGGDNERGGGFAPGPTLATALAVWLDPAVGFPVVLISAAIAAGTLLFRGEPLPVLRWSIVGGVVTTAAWLIDNPLWSPAAGELRYVHPLYALAWLGLGVAGDGWQRLRRPGRLRRLGVLELIAALPLVGALAYTQLKYGYRGWLYPSAALQRLTSLDETVVFHGLLDWLARTTPAERVFVTAPLVAAVAMVLLACWRRANRRRATLVAPAVVVAGVMALVAVDVRWAFVAALVAMPLVARTVARLTPIGRRSALIPVGLFLVGVFAWGRTLPPALQRPTGTAEPTAGDVTALIYRHFAHWLATHSPGQTINALASPELSDSLVYHGGAHVLMSTAWQSYPGQVAASRFLSAPEATEAEAVLESRGITHVILPSWDAVLPLLVHAPQEQDKTTLYSRLQRWVFPPYLRPLPYHLPPVPGFADQKLVVFKVVPPQDEALSLARLAEYFVEMDRREPATLVAKVLAASYADDPNAAVARATVAAYTGNAAALEPDVTRLSDDVAAGRILSPWDQRVQRAIVLALGRRPDLARAEVGACLEHATQESLFTLTPLQAHRLAVLAAHHHLAFPDPSLATLAASLGAEYGEPAPTAATR